MSQGMKAASVMDDDKGQEEASPLEPPEPVTP